MIFSLGFGSFIPFFPLCAIYGAGRDEMNPKGILEMTFGLEIRDAIEMRGAHEKTRGAGRGAQAQ